MAEHRHDNQIQRPTMDPRMKEMMMAIVIRNPDAYSAVSQTLTAEHFSGYDTALATLWRVVKRFHDTYGRLPARDIIEAEIEQARRATPGLMLDDEYRRLRVFLRTVAFSSDHTTNLAEDREFADWAVEICKQLMQERVAEAMRAAVAQRDAVPADLPDVLGRLYDTAQQVAGISTVVHGETYPDNWLYEQRLTSFPTNIEFFDAFMGGAQACGELYGLLGPYGSAKSTIAYMLAVEAAYGFHAMANGRIPNPWGETAPRIAFVLSYEDRIGAMRRRAMSYAARVSRTVMQGLTSDEQLSRTGNLREYEQRLFAAQIATGAEVPGEFERVRAARPVLNDHIHFLDMTGFQNRGAGSGGLPEVAARINAVLRQRNAKCGLVVIDYLGALIRRWAAATSRNVDDDNMWRYIADAPLQAKHLICDTFDCPLWLVQQLSGEANDTKPGVIKDHTKAAGAKAFGENLDFSFSISKSSLEHLLAVGCTKFRRHPAMPYVVARLEGDLGRVVSVDDMYTLDRNRFVRRGDANTVYRGDAAAAEQEAEPVEFDSGGE